MISTTQGAGVRRAPGAPAASEREPGNPGRGGNAPVGEGQHTQPAARNGRAAVDAARVFAALADPRRRELLELLGRSPGCSASSLAARLPVSRQAVAQHLAVLEDARLVSRRRAGREVLFSVWPEGLTATADWLTGLAAAWRERLESLGQELRQQGQESVTG